MLHSAARQQPGCLPGRRATRMAAFYQPATLARPKALPLLPCLSPMRAYGLPTQTPASPHTADPRVQDKLATKGVHACCDAHAGRPALPPSAHAPAAHLIDMLAHSRWRRACSGRTGPPPLSFARWRRPETCTAGRGRRGTRVGRAWRQGAVFLHTHAWSRRVSSAATTGAWAASVGAWGPSIAARPTVSWPAVVGERCTLVQMGCACVGTE